MEKGQKRITIGVLAGGILDDFTKVVSRGVLRAAKRLGVNVVVIPGICRTTGNFVMNISTTPYFPMRRKKNKPYNVTVSAGAVRIDPEEEMTLEEALAKADQKLYIAKQHRKKEVAK